MRKAAPDISRTEMASDCLRPFLSPMLPQNMAPSGRKIKARAKMAKAIKVEFTSEPGKKTWPIVMAKYV